jgi:AAA ATPase domain/Protein kinase domain
MVRPDGYVKLLDFGLARLHDATIAATLTSPLTEAGMVLGTIGYMAPEQARGESVAPESDVFALGVLLYELVTGRHPFMATSQIATLNALMWETPEPPVALNPDLPRAIDQLIVEALQKDPRLRPGAGEVMYRLNITHDSSVAVAMSTVLVAPRRSSASVTIVGRESELDVLHQEFDRTRRGQGRRVVVSAEAGMGKTMLVETFVRQLEESGEPVRIGRGRCSERLAGSEAYLPVLEALDSLQHNRHLGNLSRVLRTFAPSWYSQIVPPRENDSSAARLAAETLGGSQERLKFEIAALLEELGRLQPVVLWFDDLHWADPSTTDLLGYVAQRLDRMRVLIVTTCRPSALAQTRHRFLGLKLDLLARGQGIEIAPGTLAEAAIDRYIALQFPNNEFPSRFAALISARTEGNPLFMADLLRDLKRRQVLRRQDDQWIVAEDLSSLERELPPSVRSLIQRKMDALEEADHRLLAAAAVQGPDFDSVIVAAALGTDAEAVEDRLDRLDREHALVRFVEEAEFRSGREVTLKYRFAHKVYHDACLESLRVTRRLGLSRAIAERLVVRTGNDLCTCAADIAILFEEARENLRAAEYFNRAAQAVARLYAHDDTAALARRGLALVEREPDTPERAEIELDLQMTLGLAIKTSQGYAVPAVGRAYERAHELCGKIADPKRIIPVLIGMSAHHVVSGEVGTAHRIALEMKALFDRIGDRHLQMIGEWSLGAALFHLGELRDAHVHLSRGLELYEPAFHNARVWETGIEPGVFCKCELARSSTLLGFPDQGMRLAEEAVAAARALEHPQPLAFALLFKALIHLARRESAQVLSTYDELAAVCMPRGIVQELQWAAPLRDRALVEMGEIERGLQQMDASVQAHMVMRSTLLRPYYLVLYAGGLLRANRIDQARAALDQSQACARETKQCAYDAEHARVLAEAHRAAGEETAAEASYRQAIDIARRHGARWLELRAAGRYANFLVSLGRTDEARTLLTLLVEWFTEGRETLDYLSAEGLLRTL